MPTTVDCPACQRTLRVPDRLRGKQVKCPECGDTFPALPLLETPPSSTQPETLVYTPDANPLAGAKTDDLAAPKSLAQETAPARTRSPEPPPPKIEDTGEEHCPKCNALNPQDARRCGHCGAEFDAADLEWEGRGTRRDSEPHRGQTVLTLGVISAVCGGIGMGCPFLSVFGLGLGIPAWVMGHRDLKKMQLNLMDPRGEPQTRSGWVCGIVGTILSVLGVLMMVFIVALELFVIINLKPTMAAPRPGTGTPVPVAPAPVPGQP